MGVVEAIFRRLRVYDSSLSPIVFLPESCGKLLVVFIKVLI